MARKKKPIATLDSETDPFEVNVIPQPFIWGFYTEDDYLEFTTTEDMINHISEYEGIIYAHNGGKFDFHYLIPYINKDKKIMVINGRIARCHIGKAELRDSFCILPVSLSEFNKDKFDYSKMKKSVRHLHMDEIKKYLYNDCKYLHEFIMQFINDYGRKLTLASTSMDFFCNLSGREKENTSLPFFEDFKVFYAGGRVQCFESGIINNRIKLIDINSAYPYAMMHDHACGAISIEQENLPDKNIEQCFITIECISKGAFFFKDKGKLTFPDDNEKRIYTITGWEYLAAKDLNLISEEKIISVRRFLSHMNFKDYVNHFFEMKAQAKKEGNKARYIFAKLFMNSLYGKFASNPENYKEFILTTIDRLEDYEINDFEVANIFDENNILIQRNLPEYSHRYYNVATAASITGFVRAYLLRAIKNVERPLYCDTDSIFYIGKENINFGDELGQWDKEAEGFKMAIGGKKLYCLWLYKQFWKKNKDGNIVKYKIASKGVRLNARQIESISSGATVKYKPKVPTYSIKKNVHFIERKIRKTI